MTVELYDCNTPANLLATKTTDSTGAYLFDKLASGSYRVKFILPPDNTFTSAQAGSDQALDSDADPANGFSSCITIMQLENNYIVDAGLLPPWDYGDAPDVYGTLNTANGARHISDTGLYLGSSIDPEADGNPGVDSKGDDQLGSADEDGIEIVSQLSNCYKNAVRITVSRAGKIDAWADFNCDNDFDDAGEQILASAAVNAGENILEFEIPCDAVVQNNTYFRFRLSSAGGLSPTGIALDGEVEDYVHKCTGEYDPIGWVYCEETGEIVRGGTINVSGPGDILILYDGSTGFYQWFTDGTAGIYTMTYNSPAGYSFSTSCLPNATPIDPTGMTDPLVLGADVDASGEYLSDYSCAANPYYMTFDLAAGDPHIKLNNIPLVCPYTVDIKIKAYTNGQDANNPPGPVIILDNPVKWTYEVTTNDTCAIANIIVTDDNGTADKTSDDFHPRYVGGDDGDNLLERGEVWRYEAEGKAILGPYVNIAWVTGSGCGQPCRDADPTQYYGELRTKVPPDDFLVALSFKDISGQPVGDVLAYLKVPGEQDWKVMSSSEMKLLWGVWPYNALFRGLICPIGGLYQFKFVPPAGYSFVGPDHFELEIPAQEPYYSFAGHCFILTNGSLPAPVEPAPVVPAAGHDNTLLFIAGSPSFRAENWQNAVDGDLEGWDGTATVKRDQNGDVWATFGFADGNLYKFNYITLLTDNGSDDDLLSERQAVRFEVLVSTTTAASTEFTSIGTFISKWSDLHWYALGKYVSARYLKLRILEPVLYSPDKWLQVVEFGVNTSLRNGPVLVSAAGTAEFTALPAETRLDANYPNPFNPVTTLHYQLDSASQVTLRIMNLRGEIVATLADGMQEAGHYQVQWDATGLPSGLYLISMQAGEYSKTIRTLFLK